MEAVSAKLRVPFTSNPAKEVSICQRARHIY
jgi:hypothetical protein